MYVRTYVRTYVRIYVCVCVCVYVYMYGLIVLYFLIGGPLSEVPS